MEATLKNTFSCNKYLSCGKSHIKANMPCQDFCDYFTCDDFAIIALSDGAGSFKHSSFGSKLLVEQTIALFKERHEALFTQQAEEIKDAVIAHLSQHLKAQAQSMQIDEKELSATLLFVCCYGDKFIYGHIGDGVICCDLDGNLKVISKESKSGFKNETTFFRSNIDKRHFTLAIETLEKSMLSFYCFSDGLEPVLIANKDGKLAPLLQKFSMWVNNFSASLVEKNIALTLDNIAKNNHTLHDDLSLIIMNVNNLTSDKIRERNALVELVSQHNETQFSELKKPMDDLILKLGEMRHISKVGKDIIEAGKHINEALQQMSDLQNFKSEIARETAFITLNELNKNKSIQAKRARHFRYPHKSKIRGHKRTSLESYIINTDSVQLPSNATKKHKAFKTTLQKLTTLPSKVLKKQKA